MTSNSKWTPEAIRALGPTTVLPTLGAIFECSRWKSYQMARHGEWERVGIKVIPIGSKYRVVVQSILDVLGYGRGDGDAQEAPGRVHRDPEVQLDHRPAGPGLAGHDASLRARAARTFPVIRGCGATGLGSGNGGFLAGCASARTGSRRRAAANPATALAHHR